MFERVFDDEIDSGVDRTVDVDQTENFVAWVPLVSAHNDRTWLLNGTSIYWRLSHQFA
jgi:hypothetical protein